MSFDTLDKFHSPMRMMVMLSGSGTTLMNLIEHISEGKLAATIPVVAASKECLGAQRARDAGIETHVHSGRIASDVLDALCDEHEIDLVVLAGYLKLLPMTDRVRHRVINIHPALLPDFGGKGMHGEHVHQAVVEAYQQGKVTESGCTVHFADEEYDTGSSIVQCRCSIEDADCAQSLADRVFQLECQAYPKAINLLIQRNAKAHLRE
ncbi:MAG: phosphoribosylglycinamide formyltransferase [Phycisphaerales bacterium]|nr:phosphoribosylglycinamide formyltransferase [Phycisphaerales bacterium]